jgi:hypothetical protein
MARKATMESIVQQEFNESVLSDFVSMMFLPLIYNLLNRHSLNSWRSEGGIAPLNDLCKGKPRWRLTTLERGARCRSPAKHTLKAVGAFRGLPGCFPRHPGARSRSARNPASVRPFSARSVSAASIRVLPALTIATAIRRNSACVAGATVIPKMPKNLHPGI